MIKMKKNNFSSCVMLCFYGVSIQVFSGGKKGIKLKIAKEIPLLKE
jgi:hypothetical protein